MTHPTIELFEQRAALLDLQGSADGLEDAIASLAAWMGFAADHLTKDDPSSSGRYRRVAVPGGAAPATGVKKPALGAPDLVNVLWRF